MQKIKIFTSMFDNFEKLWVISFAKTLDIGHNILRSTLAKLVSF